MIRKAHDNGMIGEARRIPVCDALYDILNHIPRSDPDEFVFTYRGKPVADIRSGLKRACEKAGVHW